MCAYCYTILPITPLPIQIFYSGSRLTGTTTSSLLNTTYKSGIIVL